MTPAPPLRRLALCGAALANIALASCSSTRAVTITSNPAGAMIQLDGRNVGTSPANATVDFSEKKSVIVTAVRDGYFPEVIALDPDSRPVKKGHLNLVLMEDEAWKVTTTSEATNNWLRVQVDPSIASGDVWQKLIDSVTTRYASLEQLDSDSGYVRTVSERRRFQGPRGEYAVRTRFLCSMSSREPLIYKFKVQSEITDLRGDWVPYDRVFTEDAALIEELRDRLGIK